MSSNASAELIITKKNFLDKLCLAVYGKPFEGENARYLLTSVRDYCKANNPRKGRASFYSRWEEEPTDSMGALNAYASYFFSFSFDEASPGQILVAGQLEAFFRQSGITRPRGNRSRKTGQPQDSASKAETPSQEAYFKALLPIVEEALGLMPDPVARKRFADFVGQATLKPEALKR